jgi:hypothetical protein
MTKVNHEAPVERARLLSHIDTSCKSMQTASGLGGISKYSIDN